MLVNDIALATLSRAALARSILASKRRLMATPAASSYAFTMREPELSLARDLASAADVLERSLAADCAAKLELIIIQF